MVHFRNRHASRNIPALLCAGAIMLAAHPAPVAAQIDITGATFGPLVTGSATTLNGITYLNQTLPFAQLTAGGTTWSVTGAPTVTLRRGGYAPPPTDAFGNYNGRNEVWGLRNPGDPVTTVRPGPLTSMQAVLSGNNVLAGTDNVFDNAGFTVNGNPAPLETDIERVDFVFGGGVKADPNHAAVFFDLGASNNHDPFQIAPILSVDAKGNPTAYGPLLSIARGWGPANLYPGAGNDSPFTVLTDSTGVYTDALDDRLQHVGGVALPLSDLAASGTTIYGYSLFGTDVNPGGDPNNLLDWTNAAVFPQNTPDSAGGIDLVAGSGHLVTAVPEPGVIALFCGLFTAVQLMVRRHRK